MKKVKTLSYLLTPDYMFDKFDDITPDFLISIGITTLPSSSIFLMIPVDFITYSSLKVIFLQSVYP